MDGLEVGLDDGASNTRLKEDSAACPNVLPRRQERRRKCLILRVLEVHLSTGAAGTYDTPRGGPSGRVARVACCGAMDERSVRRVLIGAAGQLGADLLRT